MDEKDEVGGGLLLLFAALAALAGLAAWHFFKPAAPAALPAAPAPAAPAPAVSSEPLPALEESDAWTRGKAAGLSTDPRFAEWLKPENLLQRWAAATAIVGDGKVPGDALSFLRPKRKFAVRREGGLAYADPKSWERYDAAADVFASLDAKAAAAFFAAARPLIDQAWAGLGGGPGALDGVGRAAKELLAAPSADGAALKPAEKGIGWVYADPALEGRSPAQKQLMRMGPRNQAKVQAKVRELALALGVPEASLK